MTVLQLIEKLQALPDKKAIVLVTDTSETDGDLQVLQLTEITPPDPYVESKLDYQSWHHRWNNYIVLR